MAEALLKRWGAGRFNAYSAGSQPRGEVHPLALETLRRANHAADGYRSKSWNEFAKEGSPPPLDFVFTVCGNAAEESCPTWPGQPTSAHWGVDGPAVAQGREEERLRAFHRAYLELEARIKLFASLPLDKLGLAALKKRLEEIGEAGSSSARSGATE
jgi:protein-tyrosine-phosphatase